MCCYQFVRALGTGRPFFAEEKAVVAKARRGQQGAWTDIGAARPQTSGLTTEERALLARAWTDDGLLEHASIASFSRFALELLAVGAPAGSHRGALTRAAIDEARHTRICLSLASAYAEDDVEPAAFPFGGRVDVESDLAGIAARAAREGCIGETLAAVEAAERASHATDSVVRDALTAIAADEADHAELAWRTVAWAVRVGGAPVREAIAEVFGELCPPPGNADLAIAETRTLGHGVLDPKHRAFVHARALRDVVYPAMSGLLASA